MTKAASGIRPRVVVLGSHPGHGHSMRRYSELLAEGYRRAGFDVSLLRPTDVLSRRLRPGPVRKVLDYVEGLVLFPLRLAGLPRDARVHIADHSDALWLCAPWVPRTAMVTCHDLIAVRAARGLVAEHRTRATGRLYQALVVRGLRRAALVVAVSEATRADVAALVGAVPLTMVHNPLDPALDPREAPHRAKRADGEYALLVSTSGWRKRREHAVAVWRRLSASWPSALRLVVVGPPLSPDESAGLEAGERAALEVRDRIDDVTLSGLYAGAAVLLQVSRYEGFGWPVIEANAHGTPAVCADTPALREVGAGNVIVGDDLGAEDWDAIVTRLRDSGYRAGLPARVDRFRMDVFGSALSRAWNDAGEGRPR